MVISNAQRVKFYKKPSKYFFFVILDYIYVKLSSLDILFIGNQSKMATVFETRLIGNLGKDAVTRKMERNVIAINFPVAHNKNWKDKRTGESRTKTVWVNCTIWKKEGANMRILDFLKSGTLVELIGIPYAKGFLQDDGTIRTEIRLNVSKTNILRLSKSSGFSDDRQMDGDIVEDDDDYDSFTLDDEEF